jgi:4-amino-4-deoxy-L-arabinose transferase-like glycosyltransferase
MPQTVALTDSRWLFLLAVFLAAIIFVFPLFVYFPLLDPDEGLHASIAQEMVERGDYLAPHFLGEPFFDKPVLYFWCEALSLHIFGMHEAALRLPGLMFGLLGAVTTGILGRRMFGRKAGWVAGIFYATTILPAALAQAASHDVALIPFVNLALLFLWESDRAQSRSAVAAYTAATGLLLGLTVLTKGLIGTALVVTAYGCYLLVTKRSSAGACLRLLAAVAIAAATALPWFVAAEMENPGFLYYFFIQRHVLGFATPSQLHGEAPWWYYLPILLGGGLPWIGYLPVTISDALVRRNESTNGAKNRGQLHASAHLCSSHPAEVDETGQDAMSLLFCWLIGCTFLLSVAHSKLATYIWPVFPAVAVLAAVGWARLLEGSLSANAARRLKRTFFLSSISGPIVLPLAVFVVQKVFAIAVPWEAWLGACLAGLAPLIPLVFLAKRQWLAMLAASALSTALQFVVALTLILPVAAENVTARHLAEYFNRTGRIPVRLLVAEERLGSLVFYLDPALRAGLRERQIALLFDDQPTEIPPGTVVVIPEKHGDRASHYPALVGLSYKTVGRYRLYEIGPQDK